eukprot:TRINITY_DN39134_c0_g1_i1.p1 TRINITY_DN39134_c0_g1~~TRINITY_DN39134_c0_g1_i1.p1  ORF type:complete len:517 (-),score=28.98 TRINITY_DN39134_c0_g1_i1:196-1746(-)
MQSFSAMYTTQCSPGIIASSLLLLQKCILEQSVQHSLWLHDSMFRLATLGSDCHNANYWRFSPRDVARNYAAVVWDIARRPRGRTPFAFSLSRQFLWTVKRGAAKAESLLRTSCGPYHIDGPVRLARGVNRSDRQHVVGPVCTEMGRGWLPLRCHRVPRAVVSRTLLVLPCIFVAWANPWHHSAWWIPAIWYLRVFLGTRPEDVDVGLVFPREDSGRDAEFQGEWPTWRENLAPSLDKRPNGTKFRQLWKRQGLHGDVLELVSKGFARALVEFEGRSYHRIIVGLPSVRWSLDTPHFSCAQLQAVRALVKGTPAFHALGAATAARFTTNRARTPLLLRFVHRSRREGRFVENLKEIQELVQQKFASKLRMKVLPSAILRRMPWTAQFHLISTTDVLAGAQGAALGWLWAMEPGSAVVQFWGHPTPYYGVWCEIFGGLAKLAAVHHLCERVGPSPRLANASKPRLEKDFAEANWRQAPLYISALLAENTFIKAMLLANGPRPPCRSGAYINSGSVVV